MGNCLPLTIKVLVGKSGTSIQIRIHKWLTVEEETIFSV